MTFAMELRRHEIKSREEGKIEGQWETAKRMLLLGLPIDIIAKSTDLSPEIIRQMSKPSSSHMQ